MRFLLEITFPSPSMAVSMSSKEKTDYKEKVIDRKMALQKERRSETAHCGITGGQLRPSASRVGLSVR